MSVTYMNLYRNLKKVHPQWDEEYIHWKIADMQGLHKAITKPTFLDYLKALFVR